MERATITEEVEAEAITEAEITEENTGEVIEVIIEDVTDQTLLTMTEGHITKRKVKHILKMKKLRMAMSRKARAIQLADNNRK